MFTGLLQASRMQTHCWSQYSVCERQGYVTPENLWLGPCKWSSLLTTPSPKLRQMQMVAPKLMAEDSANNYLQRSASDESSATESLESTPTAAEAELMQGPFQRASVSAPPQEPDRQAEALSLPPLQPRRVCTAHKHCTTLTTLLCCMLPTAALPA